MTQQDTTSISLNGLLLPDWPPDLWDVQRAMYYGDALFESIRLINRRLPLLSGHWARLQAGMKAMRYALPENWSAGFWENEILRATPLSDARIRLSVWRAPGGLYLPENDLPRYMITAVPMPTGGFQWSDQGLHAGICRSVRLPVDALSGIKALNAPRYMAAQQEAKEKGWDEALLLNAYERICEAGNSNLFWFEGRRLFTPPLTDGCITGVMQKLLWHILDREGLAVQEKPATFAALQAADELFLSNAIQGIRWVRLFEGKVYDCAETRKLYEKMAGLIREKTLDF